MSIKLDKKSLLFLPLGGSNEIGMNVNLYHYNGKWIIADLGAGFAGEALPGCDMIAPDLTFVYQNLENFLGIVLTHAHEDHLGSVGYLHDKLNLPIYCTPFTAEVVKNKLEQTGALTRAKIKIVQPGSRFKLGDFDIEMIQITHSIPEMNGLMIRTESGNIFHTGDWKFDPNPVVRPTSDFEKLEAIGKEGVLAMVCDSTNVFNDRFSGSEGDLLPNLTDLIKEQKGIVYVTTFASNVARIDTICRAAEASGRKVALAGLSLAKITKFAKNTGYLKDIAPFINDSEVKKLPRNEVVVICTGCQGEDRAALMKIACEEHKYLKITSQDTVIFSSKIIPGNEKKIFALMNRFVRLRCEVFTEKDHKVHVSGHPSRQELTRMYELVKPKIAIPVHGEPTHIHEHCKLAKSLGVPKTIEIQNGEIVYLGPDAPRSIKHVRYGYLGVDGYVLQPMDGAVMQVRRKMIKAGIVIITAVTDRSGKVLKKPILKTPGIVDELENAPFLTFIEEEVQEILESNTKTPEDKLEKKIRSHIKNIFEKEVGKVPMVEVLIHRV
jgi:ribonuclease J